MNCVNMYKCLRNIWVKWKLTCIARFLALSIPVSALFLPVYVCVRKRAVTFESA